MGVRRIAIASVLALWFMLFLAAPALAFSDTASSPYLTAIEDLSSRNIVSGFDDGTFRPDANVKRMQFAKMIVLTLALPTSESDVSPFRDVPASPPGDLYPDHYIAVAAREGITQGKTPTTFDPYANITRAQVITMVVRAAAEQLESPPADWVGALRASDPTHGQNIRTAEYNHLTDGLQGLSGSWDATRPATRGEVAQLLSNLLGRAGAQVVITSDQSVVLPKEGDTYTFTAVVADASGRALDRPVTWASSDPTEVTVSRSGEATAADALGSATLTASAPGAQAAVADVIVAPPAPNTVLIQSSDVLSVGQATATLVLNDRTRGISVGDTVMSGSEGRLFAKVQSVQVTGNEVRLGLAPAVLTEAFTDLDIEIKGASRTAVLSGDTVASASSAAKTLAGVGWNISPPKIKVEVKEFQPELTLKTHWFSVQEFRLAVHTKVVEEVSPWAVKIENKAEKDFELSSHTVPMPSPLWVGPVELTLDLTTSAGIRVSASAEGKISVAAPAPTVTIEGTNGVQWTSAGGWQRIAENSPPKVEVLPEATSPYAAVKFELAVTPYVQFDVGASTVGAGIISIVGVDFAYLRADVKCSLGLKAPLASYRAGYKGPEWGVAAELVTGPKLGLSGDAAELMKFLGLKPPKSEWELLTLAVDLIGSPDPELTVSPAQLASGVVTLTASVTPGIESVEGDRVEFVGFKDGATEGTVLASGVVNGGTATGSWTTSAADNGDYLVVALVYGRIFGPLSLPYASGAVEVTVGGQASVPSPPPAATAGYPSAYDLKHDRTAYVTVEADGWEYLVLVNHDEGTWQQKRFREKVSGEDYLFLEWEDDRVFEPWLEDPTNEYEFIWFSIKTPHDGPFRWPDNGPLHLYDPTDNEIYDLGYETV